MHVRSEASATGIMSSGVSEIVEEENLLGHLSSHHSASPTPLKLEMAENTELSLQALSGKFDLAKNLASQCSIIAKSTSDHELNNITEKLRVVIRDIMENLSRVPIITSNNKEHANVRLPRNRRDDAFDIYRFEQHVANEYDNEDPIAASTTDVTQIIYAPTNGEDISFTAYIPYLTSYIDDKYRRSEDNENHSSNILQQLAEHLHPVYWTFFCPLTRKIMIDPVTIESGATFERNAVSEYFQNLKTDLDSIVCPTTGMKIENKSLHANTALQTTIAEWRNRNEATRIRVARTALSLAASEAMILDAVKDLCILSKRKENKEQMHTVGITNQLTRFLEHKDLTVRCQVLDLLRLLVEDEEGKIIVAKTRAIIRITKMLSSSNILERHASISLLLELSKSETLSETIGSTAGCILMLNNMKYNELSDPHAAEQAGETLHNLEKFSRNIKLMAENGFLEPLLVQLVDGVEETQMEMVTYLSELVLEDDMKTYVAERASQALIKMVQNGTADTRKAAFNALIQISSYYPNSEILVNAGIVPIMIDEIFTRKIHNEPMESKEEVTAILANIFESKIDLETIQVNKHGHTAASNYTIYNIAYMLKSSSSDELSINLIRMIISLTELPKPQSAVVSAIKEIEASHTIIGFLNSPSDELNIVAAKLLINLSSHMGHTIAEALCRTQGQPEFLIKNYDTEQITEKHAYTVNLLAKLPHQNLTLNLALLHQGTVSIILSRIDDVLRGETRRSRYARQYLEGLLGILVRFTTTLFEHEILYMATQRNLTSVFTNLLVRTGGSDEVQRLAATGLEYLSAQSIHLSRPPELTNNKNKSNFFKMTSLRGSRKEQTVQLLCPVHRGVCSSSTTFCLVEAKSVQKLVVCLEHENSKVVDAALTAITTLLDDNVNVQNSVKVLNDDDVLRHVLMILREHREEDIWNKAFWVIEKFLVNGRNDDKIINEISGNKVLPSALVNAFHRGNSSTKQLAQSILRYLNKVPQFSTTFTT